MKRTARAKSSTTRAPLLLLTAMLGACDPPPRVPDPPAVLVRPGEYAFGDAVAAADAAALGRAIGLLGADHGKPEVSRYVAPAGSDLRQIRQHYEASALAAGWHPIGEIAGVLSPGENAIAYRANGAAFAVVWLTPRPASATPVNVLRFER